MLERDRDAARERAGRLDGAFAALQNRVGTLDAELDAARRTAGDLRDHAGALRARLVAAAGFADEDIEPVPAPRRAEAQPGLDLGGEG